MRGDQRPMGIIVHRHRMRPRRTKASCGMATICLLAGGIFVLSSLTHISDERSALLSEIWGAADAEAGKKYPKRPKWNWDPPPPPVVPIKPAKIPKVDRNDRNDRNERSDKAESSDKNDNKRQPDEDDDDNKKSDEAGRQADVGDSDGAIPSTLQGVLKKWFSPVVAAPSQAVPANKVVTGSAGSWAVIQPRNAMPRTKAGADVTAKAAAAVAGAQASAKAAEARARRPSGGDLTMKVPLVKQTQILARNLSTSTLKSATALGMKVQSSRTFDVLGSSITQLVVPPHLDIAQAKAALQQIAPDTALSFNQQYRLFPQAKGESTRTSLEPAREIGGCSPDRCYGALTIGWQGELGACARDLKIGVIDTGIDGSHPALSHDPARINYGTIGPERRVAGNDLHGTGVLALLAGDPRSSTPGLVPRAKFYVADIFFADESGHPVSTTMHLLEALDWMERLQVQIINLSLSGPKDELVQTAIARMSRTRTVDGATRSGAIFIAAAGNGGPGAPPSYPAAYAEVVAVTAVGRDLRSYRRANHGDYIDVAAPGVDIWTALPDGRQGFQTGTSFATPYVTAIVASIYRTLPHRVRSKTAILQRMPIQDLGTPGPDRIYGRGLVNAPASCDPNGSKAPVAARRIPVTKVSVNP
jgi:minor extracellular protease Epr